jgi:hypothetical protein
MTNAVEEFTGTPQAQWQAEITAAQKEAEKFQRRAQHVVRRFLDERNSMETSSKWFNVFYANTIIMEAALYAQLPKPMVTRKFKDYQDDVARVAALIIQRSISQDLDDPRDTFDSTMRHCVEDRLVPGLAQAWLRLETDTEDIEDVTAQPDMETEEVGEVNDVAPQRITDQRVVVDYVFWEDFLWSPCRIWDERRWIARRVYMTREELIERFGESVGRSVSLDTSTGSPSDHFDKNPSVPKEQVLKKAPVWEIWCRDDRKVIWFSPNAPAILEEIDDPLGLTGFEPCPTPMLANISTSNTIPRPDYYMIQDQYQELDQINNRISLLVKACKVVGVYDKSAIGVQRMVQEGADNLLIPVDNWAMFAEKNGLKGQIDWMPLDAITNTLQQLNHARDTIKAQIYELTGISDIVRGASKASETLGAQEIKAQFAGVRIKRLQDEVARFAGEILRIKAEMQVKHFTPEFLVTKSNIMATGNDEFVEPALQLLASDVGFEWRIQVTADSMAQADYTAEKSDRVEFLTMVSGYMEKAGVLAQTNPQALPLLVSMLKWGVAGFRGASEIEGMLDKELDAMVKQASEPQPPPPPTSEEQKAQAEMQAMQQQAQIDQAKAQQEMQAEQAKAQLEMQQLQMELQAEQQRQAMELHFEQQRLMLEAQAQRMELQFQEAIQTLKLQGQMEMQDAKLEAAEAQAEVKPRASE